LDIALLCPFPILFDWKKMTPLERAVIEFRELSVKHEELTCELIETRKRRTQLVIAMRSWGMTFSDIGREVGLSAARVHQIFHGLARSDRRDRPGRLD
jgi:hypothetical protein